MSALTYHLLGVSCPERPRNPMGTKHGVTWFPQQATCVRCLVEFDRLLEAGTVVVDQEGRIRDPRQEGQ